MPCRFLVEKFPATIEDRDNVSFYVETARLLTDE